MRKCDMICSGKILLKPLNTELGKVSSMNQSAMIFTTPFSTSCGELGKHFSRGTDGNVSQNTESGQDLQLAAGSTSATLFEAHGDNSRVPEHTSSTTEDGLIRGPDFHAGSSSQYSCIVNRLL